MKTQRKQQGLSRVVDFFQVVIVRRMTFPLRLTPVAVPMGGMLMTRTARRSPSNRLTGWLPLLLGVVFLTAGPAWAGQAGLPANVPNILDPDVRVNFQPVGVATLRGNPDFPVVLLVNTSGEEPQALLLGLDARNGKDTWSLTGDPIVLIVVFADQTTIEGLYVDTGFADQGKASGSYAVVDELNSPVLPDLLKAVTAPVMQTYL
ncbi:MAG TPA: hypothetical protein VLT62_14385 [Candidatus Methylomirabilis sp.]|nr:hypothetical protein [Candidatus Methylomirabilis sp.]